MFGLLVDCFAFACCLLSDCLLLALCLLASFGGLLDLSLFSSCFLRVFVSFACSDCVWQWFSSIVYDLLGCSCFYSNLDNNTTQIVFWRWLLDRCLTLDAHGVTSLPPLQDTLDPCIKSLSHI